MVGDPEAGIDKAEFWLKQNGITSLPINPKTIAEILEIEVRAKNDAAPGVSGMLLRHGDAFGILYATHLNNEGYENFSIAHEIGHYLLEGHPEALFPGGDGHHVSHAGFDSIDRFEREADFFASGLLMPGNLVKAELRRMDEGLSAIESLADKCKTSLTATAIRYSKLTTVPAAVIMSTGGRIDWAFLSKELLEFPDIIWPRKGDLLPSGVLTETFSGSEENLTFARRATGEVELREWIGGRAGIQANEEVLGLGAYGKTLTVLTTDFLGEDDEGDLEEKWTPRFRR